MSVTSIELLRFILGLLGDSSKAEDFSADPMGALSVAGLANVSCADVDAITPLIANAAPGAFAMASAGGGGATAVAASAAPAEMIQHLVRNVAVSNYDNSGVIQNIWGAGDVQQAFASEGGLAFGGDVFSSDPVVFGDGNVFAKDTAQASGRDTIQNQGDGNLALGGDQTIAQDDGVIAGGDNFAAGDKVGGNKNEAENTGNDNSVHVGGNQHNAENTGNTTLHDESFTMGDVDYSTTIGDISVDLSDHSDNSDHSDQSTTVGGNQNNAENTGNATVVNTSVTNVDDHSVGGDYWENGSNQGGIGNTDNRNSNNTSDSGNTVTITESTDESITVGTIAVDLSDNSHTTNTDDHSVTVGDVDLSQDNSFTMGDTTIVDDHSTTSGDTTFVDDNSFSMGDVTIVDDHSTTSGDSTYVEDNSYVDDHSFSVGDVSVDLSETTSTSSADTTVIDTTYETSFETNEYNYEYDSSTSYVNSGNTAVDIDADVTVINDTALTGGGDYTWEG